MKPKKPRARIVYRDRPAKHYFSLETIRRVKEWFYVVAPLATVLWIVAGPYVDAKAAQYLNSYLVRIGMDPETVQVLNKNLAELQQTVKEKDDTVKELSDEVREMKGDIGKVLILLQTQQQVPSITAEPAK